MLLNSNKKKEKGMDNIINIKYGAFSYIILFALSNVTSVVSFTMRKQNYK